MGAAAFYRESDRNGGEAYLCLCSRAAAAAGSAAVATAAGMWRLRVEVCESELPGGVWALPEQARPLCTELNEKI